jgi:hypothetical protein
MAPIDDQTVTQNESLTFTVTASDPDDDNLRFEAVLPPWCTFTDNNQGAADVTCLPDGTVPPGDYPATFTVFDDGTPMLSDSAAFTIAVLAMPDMRGKTICSKLGNGHRHYYVDIDKFKFEGEEGEEIVVTLERDANGHHKDRRATLVLLDKIRGTFFFDIDKGRLPNSITATLPKSGRYRVFVIEQPKFFRGKRFRGDYCLTLESNGKAPETFRATRSVE